MTDKEPPKQQRRSLTHVLLVEDSKFFGSMLKNRITKELGFRVTWVKTLAAARGVLEGSSAPFSLALLDLNLPDAPNGEIVDDVIEHGIPAIVLTAQISDEVRDAIWSKRVVDYVVKDSPAAVDYVLALLHRVTQNPDIPVLVVDDSKSIRGHVERLLRVHRYEVLTASCGDAALALLATRPDVRLMLIDFNMPGMDGFTLTQRVRRKHKRDHLAIIGMSTQGCGHLAARFIKRGANDFLYKPFIAEELYCRVDQNIIAQQQLRKLEDSANRDYLTGLFNRRYFYAAAKVLLANAHRGNIAVSLAMIDIDHFKAVNDTYGHDVGDLVIKGVAQKLQKRFRASDIVARLGGEEFCVIAANMDRAHTARIFNDTRESIAKLRFKTEKGEIGVTISIGVTTTLPEDIEAMVANADRFLYLAKHGGRNRVELD